MDSYRPDSSTNATKPSESQFPFELRRVLQLIDKFTEDTLDLLDSDDRHKRSPTPASARSPSQLLETFKDAMITIQRKTSKAIHEVETKLGPNSQLGHNHEVTDAPLEDLAGVSAESEANRMLGQIRSGGKPSYKLRNQFANDPSPRLIVDNDDATAQQPTNPEDIFVVLQPTLRNVWVVQHAYARLQNHKEHLIKEYIASVDPGTALSRKFAREYYEDLGLANLPSKHKLGNLLDVRRSSHNQATHDMMIALRVQNSDGSARYVEVVTEADVNPTGEVDGSYVVFPVAEASIKMLYDTYKALRKATSEQRRAARDKEFAANLPVDAMDELEKQFNIGSTEKLDQTDGNHSKKRRRMLDDE
ncbi:hypothetical protein F5B19DRAFT_383599 [Rostrohypoxylon terebratum]|nr:hypothetical protein F5B19DRAFT_383599 [Rostrohypoxylon terebratum]